MNGIIDPISERLNAVVEDEADKRDCRRALHASRPQIGYEKILAIDRMVTPTCVEANVTDSIAKGLADIALGKYGEHGFSGLSQPEAHERLSELSGDVEEFFAPYLSRAS